MTIISRLPKYLASHSAHLLSRQLAFPSLIQPSLSSVSADSEFGFSGHSPLVTCERFATSTIVKTSSSTPDAILQTAFGFWNSKVLLTAVTFDLFTTLGQRRLTGAEIGEKLRLHPRGIADFLDALVAMEFLERERDDADAKYFNTPATALYLDRNSPRYIGGIPEMLMRGCSSTGTICRKR